MLPQPEPRPIPADQLVEQLQQLPFLPAVVTEILSMDPESDNYLDRLVRLAERDPPFAIRLIQCANSAYSAPSTPILSLEKAAMRLGTKQSAGLVIALAVVKVFVPKTDAQRFIWIHSIQTALFARQFCQDIPALHRQRDLAYLAGLLHDIGRFVQFEGAPIDLGRVTDNSWAAPDELVEVERRILGYDHTLLGWHACRKWGLPDCVGEVIRHHHDALPAMTHGEAGMVRVVQWADALSMALLLDPECDCDSAPALVRQLAARHGDIGPGRSPQEKAQWHHWVPSLRDESMALARQLNLLH